jgi:tRNA pseudouridine38-40 synthase
VLKLKNFKLTIEYNGTNYHGWQRQHNSITIQEIIENAIENITGEQVIITGSGRTDKGVHATGQAANFYSNTKISAAKIPHALNSKLPKDIVVTDCQEVEQSFHARYSAKGKEYSYQIYNNTFNSPFLREFSWHILHPLDVKTMEEACKFFLGTHDFSAFKSSGSSIKTTVRTIYTFDISKEKNLIRITTSGNGYLYNMVRIMVGTLVEIGQGKMSSENIKKLLLSKDRSLSGITAPAQGLCLEKVFY